MLGLGKRSNTFTEEGLKRLIQFFILNFCVILFMILIAFILVIGSSSSSFFDWIFSVLTSWFFTALIWILQILVILWLFWAFTDFVLGRKEFDKQHEISIFIASALIIPVIFLSLIQLILSQGISISASMFIFNPTGSLESILIQNPVLTIVTILIPVLMGPAFFLFIHKLSVKFEKVTLLVACAMLVASPFTASITALIAYIMFFFMYSAIYIQLKRAGVSPVKTAPCPFCDQDIPVESRACPYCGAKFKENVEAEIDPRLTIEPIKVEQSGQPGFTPVKGPTEEEKNRVYYIIGAIIVVVIVVATVVYLLT